MKRKYFGTDGIRGEVGTGVINPEFVLKLGWAVGRVLRNGSNSNQVLIGKDTRISGYMFESALQAGLSAAGMETRLLGPMPTPAIAYLTRTFHAVAGIVISASHNPYQDNGIKFFSSTGKKLPDDVELAIEAEMDKSLQVVASERLGKVTRIEDAAGRYIEYCKSTIPFDISLKGLKIVVDCAHGATYHTAPNVFKELGATIETIGTQPNGTNINAGYGSTQPQALQTAVVYQNADLGIALDGDGDRVLMVDGQGNLLDGDELLFIIAQARHKAGTLRGPVVGTVMSNLGLEQALEKQGISFARSAVGDRNVLEMLEQKGGNLGGESSGHILCLDRTTTGDGTIIALQILAIIQQTGLPLHILKSGMTKCPQRMINVRVKPGMDIVSLPSIKNAVEEAEQELSSDGRVLLRPSGTEPLVRVMVEGVNRQKVDTIVHQLADVVKTEAAAAHI